MDESFVKSRRAYVIASGVLAIWNYLELTAIPFVNVTITQDKIANAPFLITLVVLYLAYRVSVDWSLTKSVDDKISRFDLVIVHFIALTAVTAWIISEVWVEEEVVYPQALFQGSLMVLLSLWAVVINFFVSFEDLDVTAGRTGQGVLIVMRIIITGIPLAFIIDEIGFRYGYFEGSPTASLTQALIGAGLTAIVVPLIFWGFAYLPKFIRGEWLVQAVTSGTTIPNGGVTTNAKTDTKDGHEP